MTWWPWDHVNFSRLLVYWFSFSLFLRADLDFFLCYLNIETSFFCTFLLCLFCTLYFFFVLLYNVTMPFRSWLKWDTNVSHLKACIFYKRIEQLKSSHKFIFINTVILQIMLNAPLHGFHYSLSLQRMHDFR